MNIENVCKVYKTKNDEVKALDLFFDSKTEKS